MASTFSNLLYHIVFSTKGRAPLIFKDIETSLYAYMGGIVRGEGGILLEIGGMPEHVHLVAKLKPIVAVADAVQKVKGRSSKWINEQPGRTARFE